jgi:hypothetical protein
LAGVVGLRIEKTGVMACDGVGEEVSEQTAFRGVQCASGGVIDFTRNFGGVRICF